MPPQFPPLIRRYVDLGQGCLLVWILKTTTKELGWRAVAPVSKHPQFLVPFMPLNVKDLDKAERMFRGDGNRVDRRWSSPRLMLWKRDYQTTHVYIEGRLLGSADPNLLEASMREMVSLHARVLWG